MKAKQLILGILIISSGILYAQTITLDEVRALALANSRTLAKADLSARSAALDEKSRVYSNLPSLSLGASASVSLWGTDTVPVENPLDTFKTGARASVSQKFFEGGRSVQKAINEIASESARKDAVIEYYNVLESADNAYYAALEAASALEAEEASLQTSVTALSIADIRHQSGMLNQGDYLKALADKETRENARNQARRNLALNTAKLKILTGLDSLPPPKEIDFSRYGELITRLGNISDDAAYSLYGEMRGLFAASNPALAKALLAQGRAEKNLDAEKSKYLPSLGASFQAGVNYSVEKGVEFSGGSLSLSASIPVDFWVLSNNAAKSKLALESAALDYISAEVTLETNLQTELLNAISLAGSVLSSRRSLEYAEKHFEFVMERYRLSQSSVSEIGDASTLLITNRNAHTGALYGFLRSLSALRSQGAVGDEEKLFQALLSGGK